MKNYSAISLKGIQLSLHLGWGREERVEKQNVVVDLAIQFAVPPEACRTDKLEDTTCYRHLAELIFAATTERHFRLLENLGYEIYQVVKNTQHSESRIHIRVTKQPPIPNFTTSDATFYYGDGESAWLF